MPGRGWLRASALLALAACGGGGGSDTTAGPSGGATSSVTVGNDFYSPASLSVAIGTKVVWQWAEGASEHSVTFDDGPTSDRQSSGSFERTFGTAGTFTYFCQVHGRAVMSGSVTVGGGSGTGGGGGNGGGGGGTGGGGGYGSAVAGTFRP
jgi:plastocyanin